MKIGNVLYCGDNLHWMLRLPDEFVDLCYIDPPFFSNKYYEVVFSDGEEIRSFEDRWKGGIKNYVDWLKARVEQIYRLLKPTGSFYLHCDWHASHYLKVMCDEIFGYKNFRSELIWLYEGRELSHKYWNHKHDNILFYTKSDKWTFNWEEAKDSLKESSRKALSQYIDEEGKKFILRYKKGGGFAPLEKEGDGTYRQYVPNGVPPRDWCLLDYARKEERYGYPTQKPMALLERILKVSSNKGDLVLDCFCACGTTLAVAHKSGRRWLGIDVSPTGCKLVQYRLSKLGAKVEIIGLPRTREELEQLSPLEFQNWVLGAMGGQVADKKSRDMGIDGYTFYGLWGDCQYPVQVKRRKADRNTVDNFETSVRRKGHSKGYIVALDFTRDAYEEVVRAKKDGLDIELVGVEEVKERFLEARPLY